MTERPVSLTGPPAGYSDWLAELKTRIHNAQQRAALAQQMPSISDASMQPFTKHSA